MPINKKAIASAQKTLKGLRKLHPEAKTELKFRNPMQLMVAVILSAQATDKTVNKVTDKLFRKYKTAKDFAKIPLSRLQKDISGINFYKNKAKSIKGAAEILVEKYKASVPKTMSELVKLPGVGRKTASVILGEAYGKSEGIVVDTHVARLAQRFGWSGHSKPEKIEKDLMEIFPKRQWIDVGNLLIHHGRYVCKARNPQCQDCPFDEPFCPGQKDGN